MPVFSDAAAGLRKALTLALCCAAICVQSARAHEVPADIRLNIFVKPDGAALNLLVRVPLAAMNEVEFPLRGQGYLVVSRADEAIRHAARIYLAENFDIFENGVALPAPQIRFARVSLPSDRSFASYDEARKYIETPPLTDVVPLQLLLTTFTRSEMGLNFGGNHFLELQVVEELVDREVAGRWGFERGQVVVMYHLGPGPFSATLLNHYSRRSKLQRARVPLFFASKLLFHYLQRMGKGSASRKWALHFRRNGWSAVPDESEDGRLLRQAFAMAINFGYAYRLATVRAIVDGLHGAISPGLAWELFCDVSHNGIEEHISSAGTSWVARHNACRLEPGKPTIVAGMYDVPSYLGIGEGAVDDRLRSYDHGAGHLIESSRKQGHLALAEGHVTRFRMSRGRGAKLLSSNDIPLRSSERLDRVMECLVTNTMMRPVIRLRPLGNLKNG